MHHRFAPALATATVIAGASLFATAQMGPNDDRRLPYQGKLEIGGSPAETGEYTVRFALFTTRNANADCLLVDAEGCPLWGEEQSVTVNAGEFGATLGMENALTDDVLAQNALFLAIAVRGPNDAAFALLGGKQELLSVPYAARAAAAKDYKVTGTLTADSVVASTVFASSGDFDTVDTGRADIDEIRFRTANGNFVTLDDRGAANGIALRAQTNPAATEPIFRVLSQAGAERLRVEHEGTTSTTNNFFVGGSASINGGLTHGCIAGFTRVGEHCIEDTMGGGPPAGINWEAATAACHSEGSFLCPVRTIVACDLLQPANTACTTVTDQNQWLLTSDIVGNDTDAFDGVVIFNNNGNDSGNEVDVTNSRQTAFGGTQPYGYFCCRHAGGL